MASRYDARLARGLFCSNVRVRGAQASIHDDHQSDNLRLKLPSWSKFFFLAGSVMTGDSTVWAKMIAFVDEQGVGSSIGH